MKNKIVIILEHEMLDKGFEFFRQYVNLVIYLLINHYALFCLLFYKSKHLV